MPAMPKNTQLALSFTVRNGRVFIICADGFCPCGDEASDIMELDAGLYINLAHLERAINAHLRSQRHQEIYA